MSKIRCRSKRSANCYDGKSEESVYGEDGQDSDGTWDGQTVCCDACYIAAGMPAVPIDSPGADAFARSIEGGKG
jgi:hypothetical protein